MQLLEHLQHPWAQHALVTGVAISTVCSILSVIVVLKRMAFIGEGISHAGFAGIGTAALLALTGVKQDLAVFVLCLATGLLIGVISRRRHVEADSAIGIMLVAAMAWGVLAGDLSAALRESWPAYRAWVGPAAARPSYEQVLFGSILSVEPGTMWRAIGLGAAILVTLAALSKEILFFTFDESASRVFGVPTGFLYYLLLALLSVAIVLSIRMAGVILVGALLVVPGATAVLLSRRIGWVLFWSWGIGVAATVGGLLLSLEIGRVSTGPCIVAVLCAAFGAAFLKKAVTG